MANAFTLTADGTTRVLAVFNNLGRAFDSAVLDLCRDDFGPVVVDRAGSGNFAVFSFSKWTGHRALHVIEERYDLNQGDVFRRLPQAESPTHAPRTGKNTGLDQPPEDLL